MNVSGDIVDFALHVSEQPGGGYVVADAEGQEATFDTLLTTESIYRLSYRMAGNRTRSRYYTTDDRKLAKSVGEGLFKALISGAVETSYRTHLDEANTARCVLRITLDLTKSPSLLNYPWEFLYDPCEGAYVSATTDASFVRVFDTGHAPVTPKNVTAPLKVLVVSTRPPGLADLNIDAEVTGLKNAAINDLAGLISIQHLPDPTLGELKRELDERGRGYYDVIHFIGHGGFSGESKIGSLSFRSDSAGQVDDVSPDRFSTVVRNRGIRLAVINACEGGRTDAGDPFAGVAINLLRARFAAVIAMQFEITDSAARDFSRNLYERLAREKPIDLAVAEARSQIFADQETLEWATPVLYISNLSATTLFELKPPDVLLEANNNAGIVPRIAEDQRFVEQSAEVAANAEEQRRAAEAAAKAEEQRRAAEAAAKAEEQRRVAETAAKAEEQRRAAEAAAKAEEQRRVAETAAKAEEQRRAAEAAAKAEEQRRVAETAAKAEEQRRAAEAAAKAEEQRRAAEATVKAKQQHRAEEAAAAQKQRNEAARKGRAALPQSPGIWRPYFVAFCAVIGAAVVVMGVFLGRNLLFGSHRPPAVASSHPAHARPTSMPKPPPTAKPTPTSTPPSNPNRSYYAANFKSMIAKCPDRESEGAPARPLTQWIYLGLKWVSTDFWYKNTSNVDSACVPRPPAVVKLLQNVDTYQSTDLGLEVERSGTPRRTGTLAAGSSVQITGSLSGVMSERDQAGPLVYKVFAPIHAMTSPSGAVTSERYSIAGCGAINDVKTGLVWLIGPDINMTWDAAKAWVGSTKACAGTWRMPTIAELATLYDSRYVAGTGYYTRGEHFPAHISPVFSSIGGGSWGWSNEAVGDKSARVFNFNQGVATVYGKDNTVYSTRAFAVRESSP